MDTENLPHTIRRHPHSSCQKAGRSHASLRTIARDEIGIVQIDGDKISHQTEKILANTIPDPTISGVVDFVLAEARLYGDKK